MPPNWTVIFTEQAEKAFAKLDRRLVGKQQKDFTFYDEREELLAF